MPDETLPSAPVETPTKKKTGTSADDVGEIAELHRKINRIIESNQTDRDQLLVEIKKLIPSLPPATQPPANEKHWFQKFLEEIGIEFD